MKSTVKELSQPEVELVNTRASNVGTRNHSEVHCEVDGDTTTDSISAEPHVPSPNGCLSPDRLLRCISWCEKLQQSKLFEREKISQQSASISRTQSKSTSKTTIGLVLRGCVISELVPGGPAHCCGELNPGDKILSVDGEEVTEDNISMKLIGSDLPDTTVTLNVSRNREGPGKEISLNRAPSGIIGDRVRLFELFAAQKERAADEDRSKVQCQTWLDNVLKELVEAKRVYDEQEQRQNTEADDIKALKQKNETLERQGEQQAQIIRELKRDLETKRNMERKLRSELASCESAKQSLQTALEDSKLNLKGTGVHNASGGDSRLNDLFVATKLELDKARESLKMAKLDATQSRAAVLDLEEDIATLNERLEQAQIELVTGRDQEAIMQKTIIDSAQRLEKLQVQLEAERKRGDQEFRDSLAKDVELAKLREDLGDLRRRYDDLKNQLPSSSEVAETYQSKLSELSQRCVELQKDVNTILMMHKKMFEAICQIDSARPCGIGVRLRARSNDSHSPGTIIIESVFDGGAASASGKILEGDQLMKVDGRDVGGLSMDEVRRQILGLPGTNLTLHVKRSTNNEVVLVELTRMSGSKETIPNLEDQTTEACAVAIALYESLDQAKLLLQEADAEKEQLKRSYSQREEEVFKAVSKWAENFQGQQLAKYFKSWMRLVLMDLFHKQMGSTIRKRSNKIVLSNIFSRFRNLIIRRHKHSDLERYINTSRKKDARKVLSEWRLFCGNLWRLDLITSFNSKQWRISLLKFVFDHFRRNTESRVHVQAVSTSNTFISKLFKLSFELVLAVWAIWKSVSVNNKYLRARFLYLQKRHIHDTCGLLIDSWRAWSARRCQVRIRFGRMINRSFRQICFYCFRTWCSYTRWRCCFNRIACRRESVQAKSILGAVISSYKQYVVKKKCKHSVLTRARGMIQRKDTRRIVNGWMNLHSRFVWLRKMLNYRCLRSQKDCLFQLFAAWQKLVELKGTEEISDVVKAQIQAQRVSDNNFVQQLANYSQRLSTLENEVAVANKNLKAELRKNVELEAALSNSRDEISAYSQQVDYLRKQVRDAWAVSDAARTDLSAAIKSNDQMRNALFGRMESMDGDNSFNSRSSEILQAAKLGLGSPASAYMVKKHADMQPKGKGCSDFTDA